MSTSYEVWPSQAPVEDDSRLHREMTAELERLRAEVRSLRDELSRLRQEPAAPASAPRDRRTQQWMPPATPAVPSRPAFAEAPPAPFPASPSGPTFLMPLGQGLDFGAVSQLSPEQLDSLPYGLITLDANGRVLHYNDTESRMVGLPKERVVGRSFFGEVAPCARVREFQGRFEQLARDPLRVRVQTFDFVFRFANGEQQVTIVMTPARTRGQFHVALLRRSGLSEGGGGPHR